MTDTSAAPTRPNTIWDIAGAIAKALPIDPNDGSTVVSIRHEPDGLVVPVWGFHERYAMKLAEAALATAEGLGWVGPEEAGTMREENERLLAQVKTVEADNAWYHETLPRVCDQRNEFSYQLDQLRAQKTELLALCDAHEAAEADDCIVPLIRRALLAREGTGNPPERHAEAPGGSGEGLGQGESPEGSVDWDKVQLTAKIFHAWRPISWELLNDDWPALAERIPEQHRSHRFAVREPGYDQWHCTTCNTSGETTAANGQETTNAQG